MKKLISLALVATTLFVLSAAIIPVGAGPSFDPTYISQVEAKYFDVKPFIDGYVTEAEWGTPTFYASQEYAAKIGDTEPVGNWNIFFAAEPGRGYDAAVSKMEFEAWLRWDEEFFYVAVKVDDPDGHALKNGRQNTWNGDAIQFRVDAEGSNARSFNDRFYPQDDKTGQNKPWGNVQICDIVLGYCELAGGFSEAYENSVTGSEYSLVPYEEYEPTNGSVKLGIAPAGYTYSTDTAKGITTYEVAVPWIYIDDYYYGPMVGYDRNNCHKYVDSATDKNGAIGRYYGMTLVTYNADGNKDEGQFNAALTWGSGIYNTQMREALATCGGSNEVYISADKVSADPAYTGVYNKYTEGGLPTPPNPPDYAFDIDPNNYIKLTYDNEADMDILGWISNGDRIQDTDGNWVLSWNEDNGTGTDADNNPGPTESGLNEQNYISTDGEGTPEPPRWTAKDASFTCEFDIKITGLEHYVDYPTAIYTWFGGQDQHSYRCGYFFDDGKFKITDDKEGSEATVFLEKSANLSLNEWHHWVFQYDNKTTAMRFYIDPKMDPDGTVNKYEVPLLEKRYRYFDYGSSLSPMFIFRRMNAQIMIDNVEFYNFVDFTETGRLVGWTSDIVITQSDIEVEVSIEQREDGTFAASVPVDKAILDENLNELLLKADYDDKKLVFKGIEGLDEKTHTVEIDEKGNIIVELTDLSILKSMKEGDVFAKLIFEPVESVTLTAEEVKESVKVIYTITTLSYQTGDTVIPMIIILTSVALASFASIITIRRKKRFRNF